MSSYEDKIKEQATPYLQAGESVLAAFVARPKGSTMVAAGRTGGRLIAGKKLVQQQKAAIQAGLRLASPMALALTGTRLVVFSISPPLTMGKGGDIKELVSSASLADVDSIEVKRLMAGKTVTLTVHGIAFKLEVGGGSGGNAQGLADEFTRAKAVTAR